MTFADFIQLYMKDFEERVKPSTKANKVHPIELKIILFFGKKVLEGIKPTDVHKWQNELKNYRNKNSEGYSETYLRSINNQLTAIFNYAVKYYGLKENPCHKAGTSL
ncbi:N-terminal phage integrase SAM-like domain-containing protein [Dielma fastidiosa]|uniref:N-terminal phage integrase SAM-like domain-containing protein n=1 Tax=Dielma fastidiosa TaxID=1034346 RepID=A0AB35UPF6_9FIRM|nr:N-terminal phage integrase SAM-like domain-containing protein [Dielma fastidiosa]MDY5167772.1 N-terminal phage integrase SAM-like domain-containing protein [Dielma fastidiosa]